jgi:hypothetical protein
MKARFINIPEIEKHYRIDEDGAIFSLRKHKYLKPTFNTVGYLYVYIRIDNNAQDSRFYAVHRLVATKYIGQCPDNKETSHKDGNKLNNTPSNLEYLSHSENILKAYREHGRVHIYNPADRTPFSDATKALMSNAKKKQVIYTPSVGKSITYDSIEDAAQSLHSYRKKIYLSIYNKIPFNKGTLAFVTSI